MVGVCQKVTAPPGNRHADAALEGDQFDVAGAGVEGAEHVGVAAAALFLAELEVCTEEENVDDVVPVDRLDGGEDDPRPGRVGGVNLGNLFVHGLEADLIAQNKEPHGEKQKQQDKDKEQRQYHGFFMELYILKPIQHDSPLYGISNSVIYYIVKFGKKKDLNAQSPSAPVAIPPDFSTLENLG